MIRGVTHIRFLVPSFIYTQHTTLMIQHTTEYSFWRCNKHNILYIFDTIFFWSNAWWYFVWPILCVYPFLCQILQTSHTPLMCLTTIIGVGRCSMAPITLVPPNSWCPLLPSNYFLFLFSSFFFCTFLNSFITICNIILYYFCFFIY